MRRPICEFSDYVGIVKAKQIQGLGPGKNHVRIQYVLLEGAYSDNVLMVFV